VRLCINVYSVSPHGLHFTCSCSTGIGALSTQPPKRGLSHFPAGLATSGSFSSARGEGNNPPAQARAASTVVLCAPLFGPAWSKPNRRSHTPSHRTCCNRSGTR
jgi:hypothetical protein